jgi:hypothetical protein
MLKIEEINKLTEKILGFREKVDYILSNNGDKETTFFIHSQELKQVARSTIGSEGLNGLEFKGEDGEGNFYSYRVFNGDSPDIFVFGKKEIKDSKTLSISSRVSEINEKVKKARERADENRKRANEIKEAGLQGTTISSFSRISYDEKGREKEIKKTVFYDQPLTNSSESSPRITEISEEEARQIEVKQSVPNQFPFPKN